MYAVRSIFLFSNVYSNRKRANNCSQINSRIFSDRSVGYFLGVVSRSATKFRKFSQDGITMNW